MTQKATKLNSANATIIGNIATNDLESKHESIIKNIAKNAKLPGFRKGKIPSNVIMARYKEQIDQDAKQAAIQDMLSLGLKELGIETKSMLGDPIITKFDENDKGIDIEMKLSFAPKVDIGKIDSLVPDFDIKNISKKDIDARVEEIAKSRAPLEEAKASATLKNDNVATIDFKGFIDGVAFEGGEAKDFRLAIGSKQFIEGFEDALIGMKVGQEKDIKVTFPKEYGKAELAGKPATFNVKLHKIEVKGDISIDDNLAKSLMPSDKDASLSSLKDMIKEQLTNEEKSKIYNGGLKEKLLDSLLGGIKFDLPEMIIEQEMDIVFRNAIPSLPKEEFEELKTNPDKAKAKRDSYRAEASKSVQATFIIDAIARQESIGVSDQEVAQTLYYEAMMSGQDPKATLEYYQKNNLIQAVKMAMIEDRVLGFLLDKKLKAKDSKEVKEPKEPKESKSSESKSKKTTK